MAVFHCGRFPVGEVPIRTSAGLVYFVDGRAEIHNRLELIAALREVDPKFQITEDVDGGGNHGPAPARTSPRKRTKSKET